MATVRTRKRGKTYSYIFEAGRTLDGKRKVVEKGGFATKDDAYKAGTEAYTSFLHGNIGIVSEKVRLSAFLKTWLEAIDSQIRPSTKRGYSFYIRMISKRIGNIMLNDLKPVHIAQMVNDCYADGLAYSTISTLKRVLSAALNYAIYPAGLIAYNPIVNIKIPKQAPREVIKRTIISQEQIKAIADATRTKRSDYLTPVIICFHTGMRIGEAFGLVWDNIDLDRKTITIMYNRSSVRDKYLLQPLKTEQSYRTIYIDDFLAAYLGYIRESQLTAREDKDISFYRTLIDDTGLYMQTTSDQLPEGYREVYPVCCNDNGKLFSFVSFFKFMKSLGINSHSFRHTQATLLAEANTTAKHIAARLGHKSTAITQDIYTHITDTMQRDALTNFEAYLNADKEANADKLQTNKKSS